VTGVIHETDTVLFLIRQAKQRSDNIATGYSISVVWRKEPNEVDVRQHYTYIETYI